MGRQLLLHLLADDEEAFANGIRSTGNVRLLAWMSKVDVFPELSQLPPQESSDFWADVCLHNEKAGGAVVTKFVPAGNYYIVDEDRSPVIQWTRSRLVGQKLKPGRIWAEFEYFDRESRQTLDKGVDFRRWYDSVERWVKKNLSRTNPRFYAGRAALEFRKAGGILDWWG